MNHKRLTIYQKRYHGFTLIEILVAITIIAILTSIGMAAYSKTRKSADMAKRAQTLNEIASSLESYRAAKGRYPVAPTFVEIKPSTALWTELEPFMKKLPKDPTGAYFQYRTDTSGLIYKVITDPNIPDADFSTTDLASKPELVDPSGQKAWAVFNGDLAKGWVSSLVVVPPASSSTPTPTATSGATATPTAAATATPTATPSPTPSPTVGPNMCLASGLITWWKLDGNGNAAVGGNNFNLTNLGGVIFVPGKIGQAAQADHSGVNEALQCLDSNCGGRSGLDPQSITISAWVKPNAYTGYLFQKLDSSPGNYYYATWLTFGGNFTLEARPSSGVVNSTSITFSNTSWTLLTASYDSASGTLRVCKNDCGPGNVSTATVTSGDLIDHNSTFILYPIHLLDEVSVWNRALTQAEISSLYNGGAGVTCP